MSLFVADDEFDNVSITKREPDIVEETVLDDGSNASTEPNEGGNDTTPIEVLPVIEPDAQESLVDQLLYNKVHTLGVADEVKSLISNPNPALRFSSKQDKSTGKKYFTFIISGPICHQSHYITLLETLKRSDSNTNIDIYINSPGGYVTTGAIICAAMARSKAFITTHAIGICASAASMIWSQGQVCKVSIFARLMYHMSSHGDQDVSTRVRDKANLAIEYVKESLLKVALEKGHIREDELEDIEDANNDKWFSADVMTTRLQSNRTV